MTVTYSLEVSSAKLSGFAKLLFRWQGGIYKMIYKEILIFYALFLVIAVIYRNISEPHQGIFNNVIIYSRTFTALVPMTFVMGFFVSLIFNRWWDIYMNLPWPDKCCLAISTLIRGTDERGRLIRRTLARYLNLMNVLTFQMCSSSVKKRFPTLDHIVEAGLMTKEEKNFQEITIYQHGLWWLPASWFTSLITQARLEGRIYDEYHVHRLMDELFQLRSSCGMLLSYDWISVPLVYTQVVTIAVYTYFIASIFSSQIIHHHGASQSQAQCILNITQLLQDNSTIKTDPTSLNCTFPTIDNIPSSYRYTTDLVVLPYLPLVTLVEFFFYVGWLKVAEVLMNPLGTDDDDFELNYLIDRNISISYLLVDFLHKRYPKLERDIHWSDPQPNIPYTVDTIVTKIPHPWLGSAFDIVPKHQEFVASTISKGQDTIPNVVFRRGRFGQDPSSSTKRSTKLNSLKSKDTHKMMP